MADNKQTNVPAPAPANGGAVEPKVNPKTLALKNVMLTHSLPQ